MTAVQTCALPIYGHAIFLCDEGLKARDAVVQARETGERVNVTLKARAVLEKNPEDPVAEFALTLSLKKKA